MDPVAQIIQTILQMPPEDIAKIMAALQQSMMGAGARAPQGAPQMAPPGMDPRALMAANQRRQAPPGA